MTDRLKLSDLNGDKSPDQVARRLIAEDLAAQIKALEQCNAELERLLKERAKASAPGSAPLGARKHASFKAVSSAPSINKTPRGSTMVPVAYPTISDLSNSVGTAKTVRFNGRPVYLLDNSTQPSCKGDEAGSGGGIRSGTINGEVKPVGGSRSVKVEGKGVVRAGDACTMNSGNNPGIYVAVPAPSGEAPKFAIMTSNPIWTLVTPNEHNALQHWIDHTREELVEAAKHPIEGLIGAGKGLLNTLPDLGEVIMKGAARKRAVDLEDSAVFHDSLSNSAIAADRKSVAQKLRAGGDQLHLPRLDFDNAAQEGGEKISVFIQLFATGGGVFKTGAKFLRVRERVSEVTRITEKLKHRPISVGDGVKIEGKSHEVSASNELRTKFAGEIEKANTFKPVGISRAEAEQFLNTPDGHAYLEELIKADPASSPNVIYERAIDQVLTGSTVPTLERTSQSLLKIVPTGESVSRYSPFFTTQAELERAKLSGKSLADYFGLPIKSEAEVYDIFQISPKGEAKVFISEIAPTSELSGAVQRSGRGKQFLVPNRTTWTDPIGVGSIRN